jgi:hypothetical protein
MPQFCLWHPVAGFGSLWRQSLGNCSAKTKGVQKWSGSNPPLRQALKQRHLSCFLLHSSSNAGKILYERLQQRIVILRRCFQDFFR